MNESPQECDPSVALQGSQKPPLEGEVAALAAGGVQLPLSMGFSE